MEKIKKFQSLKWRFLLYVPIPLILSYIGVSVIGVISNDAQYWYMDHFFGYEKNDKSLYYVVHHYEYEYIGDDDDEEYIKYKDDKGNVHVRALYDFENKEQTMPVMIGYQIVSFTQVILMPLWVVLCMAVASYLFYKKEIEGGLKALLNASEKISNNELEFEMTMTKENEIGLVCDSVEKMRVSLLATSKENIRMIEESKRLNAAFSHDIRTPITVMKGYVDLLEKYIPEGKVSKEKELEILGMMHNQVERLERYALSMSSIQKLEDITPSPKKEEFTELAEEMKQACMVMDNRVTFRILEDKEKSEDDIRKERFSDKGQKETLTEDNLKEMLSDQEKNKILVDKELIFEVVENVVFNATRYAKDKIAVTVKCGAEYLEVKVADDGNGFSDMILKKVGNPYLREDKTENKEHFGLGIYMSKMLCEKCGGGLELSNENGAVVKVFFKI